MVYCDAVVGVVAEVAAGGISVVSAGRAIAAGGGGVGVAWFCIAGAGAAGTPLLEPERCRRRRRELTFCSSAYSRGGRSSGTTSLAFAGVSVGAAGASGAGAGAEGAGVCSLLRSCD